MQKPEFLKLVAKKAEVSQEMANKVVNAAVEVIATEVMEHDGTFALTGLGTFKPKVTAAHEARNPQTGGKVQVPATKTIGFRPMPSVKKNV